MSRTGTVIIRTMILFQPMSTPHTEIAFECGITSGKLT